MISIDEIYILNIYGRNGKAMLYCTYEYVFGFILQEFPVKEKVLGAIDIHFFKFWRNS